MQDYDTALDRYRRLGAKGVKWDNIEFKFNSAQDCLYALEHGGVGPFGVGILVGLQACKPYPQLQNLVNLGNELVGKCYPLIWELDDPINKMGWKDAVNAICRKLNLDPKPYMRAFTL